MASSSSPSGSSPKDFVPAASEQINPESEVVLQPSSVKEAEKAIILHVPLPRMGHVRSIIDVAASCPRPLSIIPLVPEQQNINLRDLYLATRGDLQDNYAQAIADTPSGSMIQDLYNDLKDPDAKTSLAIVLQTYPPTGLNPMSLKLSSVSNEVLDDAFTKERHINAQGYLLLKSIEKAAPQMFQYIHRTWFWLFGKPPGQDRINQAFVAAFALQHSGQSINWHKAYLPGGGENRRNLHAFWNIRHCLLSRQKPSWDQKLFELTAKKMTDLTLGALKEQTEKLKETESQLESSKAEVAALKAHIGEQNDFIKQGKSELRRMVEVNAKLEKEKKDAEEEARLAQKKARAVERMMAASENQPSDDMSPEELATLQEKQTAMAEFIEVLQLKASKAVERQIEADATTAKHLRDAEELATKMKEVNADREAMKLQLGQVMDMEGDDSFILTLCKPEKPAKKNVAHTYKCPVCKGIITSGYIVWCHYYHLYCLIQRMSKYRYCAQSTCRLGWTEENYHDMGIKHLYSGARAFPQGKGYKSFGEVGFTPLPEAQEAGPYGGMGGWESPPVEAPHSGATGAQQALPQQSSHHTPRSGASPSRGRGVRRLADQLQSPPRTRSATASMQEATVQHVEEEESGEDVPLMTCRRRKKRKVGENVFAEDLPVEEGEGMGMAGEEVRSGEPEDEGVVGGVECEVGQGSGGPLMEGPAVVRHGGVVIEEVDPEVQAEPVPAAMPEVATAAETQQVQGTASTSGQVTEKQLSVTERFLQFSADADKYESE